MTKPIRIPLRHWLADFTRGPLVGLVWVCAALTAVWMLGQRPRPVDHLGWVPPVEHAVTAPTTGRVAQFLVRPMQEVRRGQIVAKLDSRALEARLETAGGRVLELEQQVRFAREEELARARIAEEEAERHVTTERFRWEADLRRYVIDETDLTLSIAALELELATDRVEVDLARARLERARHLVALEAGPHADVEDLTLARDVVLARIAGTEQRLAVVRTELAAATERRLAFQDLRPPSPASPALPVDLETLRAAVAVQALFLGELELERRNLTLVSPVAGVVAALMVSEGQTVLTGRPVLTVTAGAVGEAVVYLEGEVAREELVGRAIALRTLGPSPRTIHSTISAAAPGLELLPERLWKQPEVPQYGRPASVPLGSAEFLPGEVLSAMLDPQTKL